MTDNGDQKRVRVLLVTGGPEPADEIVLDATGGVDPSFYLAGETSVRVDVALLCRTPPRSSLAPSLVMAPPPRWRALLTDREEVGRAVGRMSESVLGRTALSLSPLDPGRDTWARARRTTGLLAAVRGVDLAVAVDEPALRTAWHLVHGGAVDHAFRGLLAASHHVSMRPGPR